MSFFDLAVYIDGALCAGLVIGWITSPIYRYWWWDR